jgi:hypothetical protein
MALTSEQIATVLSSLGQTRAATGIEKRRRAPRVKSRGVVKVVPYTDGVASAERPAILVDFSSRGVAIRFTEAVPGGAYFVLVLQKNARETVRLLCAVAHCRKVKERDYSIGAEFVGPAGAPEAGPTTSRARDEAARIAGSILG